MRPPSLGFAFVPVTTPPWPACRSARRASERPDQHRAEGRGRSGGGARDDREHAHGQLLESARGNPPSSPRADGGLPAAFITRRVRRARLSAKLVRPGRDAARTSCRNRSGHRAPEPPLGAGEQQHEALRPEDVAHVGTAPLDPHGGDSTRGRGSTGYLLRGLRRGGSAPLRRRGVVDSRRASCYTRQRHLPIYYFPTRRGGHARDQRHSTRYLRDGSYWSVRSRPGGAENAPGYPEPLEKRRRGRHVAFYWNTMERGGGGESASVHARDPSHRVDVTNVEDVRSR